MKRQIGRKMIAEDGPGWAVTGYEDRILPGRWETEADATHEGLLGVYLLSGVEVKQPWRRTQLVAGWWQVYGTHDLRHDVFGTVAKVNAGWLAVTYTRAERRFGTLAEGCQWVADQFKPTDK
jgi:hypothetical protein